MTFLVAFAIGFSVASIPGPTIFVIGTETLRRGFPAGLKTMLAPLLADIVVMLPLGLWLQGSLFSGRWENALAVLGSGLLLYLGYQSIQAGNRKSRFRPEEARGPARREMGSFIKGLLVHLSSPYPYLYWGTVGAAWVRQGYEAKGLFGGVTFPLGFWAGTTVFNLLAIYVIARGKGWLPPRWEPALHYGSGALLVAGAIYWGIKAAGG